MDPKCHAQGARISLCQKYRFDLRRFWGSAPYCLWIMLNPSTADARVNDRTISKIMGFSNRWGYGGLVVVNLFAFRATDPDELLLADDPVGPNNDHYIMSWATKPEIRDVYVGWGSYGGIKGRGLQIGRALHAAGVEMKCLFINENGHPKHPLYVANDTVPKVWTPDRIREN